MGGVVADRVLPEFKFHDCKFKQAFYLFINCISHDLDNTKILL